MKRKFGSSMAHLSVIKSKFPIFSLRASWPGPSYPHTEQWSGRMMVLPVSHMQRKCFSCPWVSHQLIFKSAHSINPTEQLYSTCRYRRFALSANYNNLTKSILFYIILFIAIYCCDSFFSCLTCCKHPGFIFSTNLNLLYPTSNILVVIFNSFLRVLILLEMGCVKGSGILLEQKLKLPITSHFEACVHFIFGKVLALKIPVEL